MEYVVNNELSNKFDLKREHNVFGAIRSVCMTWIHTYGDRLKSCDDEDVVYLIQQLHNRIGSFMKNIAEKYYDAYERKDVYLVYDNDNLSDDNYHLVDNDSLRVERIVERTVTYVTGNSVDFKLCKISSDSNVKTDELKSIIEAVLSEPGNIIEIKELIRLITADYFQQSSSKDVRDIDFINKSIAPKPNTKNPIVLRQKEIIEGWLDEKSAAYKRRKSRAATRSSYFKSVITYFVLCIHNANK